jgi:cysteine desulfurase / selenocysteine lyase
MQKLQAINFEEIRKDFPILSFELEGKSLVYLDNAATTQKPSRVIESIKEYYESSNANVGGRSMHNLSESADLCYVDGKRRMASLFNATEEEIVFTKNATEAFNLLSYSLGEDLEEGDEIILTVSEHHSNLVPWQQLAKKKNLNVWFVKLNDDFTLDLEDLKNVISERTKIISITHLSNILGVVNPIEEIAEIIRSSVSPNARFIVDAAQSAAKIKIDVKEVGCDFLVWTGHKMYGPTGIGGLYGRKELLTTMTPFMTGGGNVDSVTLKEAKISNASNSRFEAGTPPIAEASGMIHAIGYINEVGIENINLHERQLMDYAVQKLDDLPGVTIIGPKENRIGVLSFTIEGVHSHDVADIFNKEFNVAIRAGHHCAQPLLNELGFRDCARISFAVYNTEREIDVVIEAIHRVQEIFK